MVSRYSLRRHGLWTIKGCREV